MRWTRRVELDVLDVLKWSLARLCLTLLLRRLLGSMLRGHRMIGGLVRVGGVYRFEKVLDRKCEDICANRRVITVQCEIGKKRRLLGRNVNWKA